MYCLIYKYTALDFKRIVNVNKFNLNEKKIINLKIKKNKKIICITENNTF